MRQVAATLLALVVLVVGSFAGWAYYTNQPAAITFQQHSGPVEKRDPQETDPVIGPVICKAKQEADELLKNEKARYVGLGWCHVAWGKQKAILNEKYGINWRTPAEMNPHLAFD